MRHRWKSKKKKNHVSFPRHPIILSLVVLSGLLSLGDAYKVRGDDDIRFGQTPAAAAPVQVRVDFVNTTVYPAIRQRAATRIEILQHKTHAPPLLALARSDGRRQNRQLDGAGADCRDACQCVKNERTVICDSKALQRLPTELGAEVVNFYLKKNRIDLIAITALSVRGLFNLEKVEISQCGVQVIESGAFAELTKLRELSLSQNKLTRVPPAAFRGLYLKSLDLSGNAGLELVATSFCGLSVQDLYLNFIGLRSLNAAMLGPLSLSLRLISLLKNQLSDLPGDFFLIASQLQSLQLRGNQLDCSTCGVKRLLVLLASQQRRRISVDVPLLKVCSNSAKLNISARPSDAYALINKKCPLLLYQHQARTCDDDLAALMSRVGTTSSYGNANEQNGKSGVPSNVDDGDGGGGGPTLPTIPECFARSHLLITAISTGFGVLTVMLFLMWIKQRCRKGDNALVDEYCRDAMAETTGGGILMESKPEDQVGDKPPHSPKKLSNKSATNSPSKTKPDKRTPNMDGVTIVAKSLKPRSTLTPSETPNVRNDLPVCEQRHILIPLNPGQELVGYPTNLSPHRLAQTDRDYLESGSFLVDISPPRHAGERVQRAAFTRRIVGRDRELLTPRTCQGELLGGAETGSPTHLPPVVRGDAVKDERERPMVIYQQKDGIICGVDSSTDEREERSRLPRVHSSSGSRVNSSRPGNLCIHGKQRRVKRANAPRDDEDITTKTEVVRINLKTSQPFQRKVNEVNSHSAIQHSASADSHPVATSSGPSHVTFTRQTFVTSDLSRDTNLGSEPKGSGCDDYEDDDDDRLYEEGDRLLRVTRTYPGVANAKEGYYSSTSLQSAPRGAVPATSTSSSRQGGFTSSDEHREHQHQHQQHRSCSRERSSSRENTSTGQRHQREHVTGTIRFVDHETQL